MEESSREGSSMHTRHRSMEEGTLDPNDFADVFGGPPRIVLARKFSAEYTNSNSFYEEIFHRELVSPELKNIGKSLPEFRIPENSEEFYKDIFGCKDSRRTRERSRPNSKGKSKSNSDPNSSPVLNSDWPVIGDDAAFSSFTSKLRPINVACRWNSSTMMHEEQSKKQGFLGKVVSPETISVKVSADDPELNSPESDASSVHRDAETSARIQGGKMKEKVEQDEDEDEVMSSYVIEISSDQREESSEMGAIDEAIAWAKEKFQSQTIDHSAKMQRTRLNYFLV